MTLPEELTDPAVLIIAAAVLLALVWLSIGSRKRTRKRNTEQTVAAMQVERDVLRANHAVEIATLEGKLAEAEERARQNRDATLRVRELEQEVARLKAANAAPAVPEVTASAADRAALVAERDRLAARLEELKAAQEELDRTRGELAEASALAESLRGDLEKARQETAGTAEGETARSADERIAALTAELDEVRGELERRGKANQRLRKELAALKEGRPAPGREEELTARIDALAEKEKQLEAALVERDGTIAALHEAAGKAGAGGAPEAEETARLRRDLQAAEERERAANENLSRLAQEAEEARQRLSALEGARAENEAELEKREALLELRLQKVYELEARLRDQHALLRETERRADLAESRVAELEAARLEADGADEPGDPARAAELRSQLEDMRQANAALASELDALRRAADAGAEGGDADGATAERLAALQARNAALEAELSAARKAVPEISAQDVAALRRELKTLAERFLSRSGAPQEPEGEPSLAERIRAFKAARAAQRNRGG